MKLVFKFTIAAAALIASFSSARAGAPTVTARHLYVSCILLEEQVSLADYEDASYFHIGPPACADIATAALAQSSLGGAMPPSWCPTKSLDLSLENIAPMVEAYLAYYDSKASEIAGHAGEPAFMDAMKSRFPCSVAPPVPEGE